MMNRFFTHADTLVANTDHGIGALRGVGGAFEAVIDKNARSRRCKLNGIVEYVDEHLPKTTVITVKFIVFVGDIELDLDSFCEAI